MGTGVFFTIGHQRILSYAEDYIKYKLTQYQFNLPSDVVFRHLLAFAFANATHDFTPPTG